MQMRSWHHQSDSHILSSSHQTQSHIESDDLLEENSSSASSSQTMQCETDDSASTIQDLTMSWNRQKRKEICF